MNTSGRSRESNQSWAKVDKFRVKLVIGERGGSNWTVICLKKDGPGKNRQAKITKLTGPRAWKWKTHELLTEWSKLYDVMIFIRCHIHFEPWNMNIWMGTSPSTGLPQALNRYNLQFAYPVGRSGNVDSLGVGFIELWLSGK